MTHDALMGPSRRPRVLVFVTLGLMAWLPSPLVAQDTQRAILQLSVNLVEQDEAIVLLRAGDVLMRMPDLVRAGLRGFSGRREVIGGEEYVSLASLGPGITFVLDERALALRLTAQTAFLASTVLDLGPGPPPGIIYQEDTSAFLNYAVISQNFDGYSLFGEAGLSVKGALLFSSASRDTDGTMVRGLSNLTIDDRSRLVRWVAGDHFARSDPLGGNLVLGGVSASREFGIDPYLVTFPTIQLSGATLTPSTADVYVNGLLLRREQLAPGTFELRNLPLPVGGGISRVVIRDVFGREQQIATPFYLTRALLTEGLHDYSYNLGFRRDNLATESWDYGRLGFLGRHRVGLTSWLSPGLRLELASDLVSGGPTVTVGLPFGDLELIAAASRDGDLTGAAGSIAYQYSGRPVSFGASVRATSDRYATLSLRPTDDRSMLDTTAFVGIQVGPRASLTLQHARSDFRDRGREDRVSVNANVSLTKRMSLFLSAGRSSQRGSEVAYDVFAGLSVFVGERTTGGVSYHRQGGQSGGTVDVQRSLPVGSGFGYRVQADANGETEQGSATLQYQGPWGRYEAGYQNTNGTGVTTLSAAGGLVAIGGSAFATRPVNDSFALIRVPGVEGVRGYVNNQEIGRTNGRGDLPVPSLLPYYGNRLRIADEDIPLDHKIAAMERTIAPPLRGGALVAFPVERIRAVTGKVVIVIAGAVTIPVFGELVVTAEGREIESPIGRDGEFYLEDVPAGQHRARIAYREAACSFILTVPGDGPAVVDLGTLPCDQFSQREARKP